MHLRQLLFGFAALLTPLFCSSVSATSFPMETSGLSKGFRSGCSDTNSSIATLATRLSANARILTPDGNTERWNTATERWTEWCAPGLDVVVEVACEEDVAATVKWANEVDRPFLALSGMHGGTLGLRGVENGVGIAMRNLDSVELVEEGGWAGTAVVAGGGSISGPFLKKLWELGKMSVAGCCETTGLVAPMLGGGHGFLQGQYGLMADQLISARLVTASGDIISVDETESAELFWALRGAGHNFGIVTEVTYKVYDRTPENEVWSHETFAFDGVKLEEVYAVADAMVGEGMPVELLHFTLMAWDMTVDPDKPIIILWLLHQGPSGVPPQYSSQLTALDPLSRTIGTSSFTGLPAVLGFAKKQSASVHGKTWLRFPASSKSYNIPALRETYDTLASFPAWLAQSSVITEAYSTHGVQAVPEEETAVPDRGNYLLMAAFITYIPGTGKEQDAPDAEAVKLGKEIQSVLAKGAWDAGEKKGLDAYVNYALGDEGMEAWYGREEWRLERLRGLKRRWDPRGCFGWYCPIE